jgi:integrase
LLILEQTRWFNHGRLVAAMLKKITKEAVDRLPPRSVLWDTDVAGFGVRRQLGETRTYVVKFRHKGKQRFMTLGHHGRHLTAEEARRWAKRALGAVADGRDPAEELAARKAPSKGDFEETVAAFIRLYAKPRNRTWEETEWIFEKYVTCAWRDRSAAEIKRRDVAALLDRIESENGPVMADRVLAAIRKLFNWIATRDDEFRTPIVKGMARTKPKERARDRVLSDDEIRALWAATEAARPPPFGPLVRCLLLTAQRREEVAQMRRREIEGDTWTIPADRYKTGRANVVPLSKRSREIVDAQPAWRRGDFVFTTTGDAPFSGFSKAKRDVEAVMLKELRKRAPDIELPRWTLHDLRRTAKTLMARAGVRPDISERVLGHVIPGVEGTYDRHSYAEEKREALEKLATMVDRILAPPAPNVVELRSAS